MMIHRSDHSRCESRTIVPPWGNPTAARSGVNQIEQSLCDPLVILRMLSILVGGSMRKASGGSFGVCYSALRLIACSMELPDIVDAAPENLLSPQLLDPERVGGEKRAVRLTIFF